MRTKTLLLTAAFGAVSIATSMSQVFSENSVGYYVKDLEPGFNLIANQLNNGDNNINTLIPDGDASLDNARLLKWDVANQTFLNPDTYFNGAGWLDTAFQPSVTTLSPGEGAFLQSENATSITLVGEVPQGDFSIDIPVNFSLLSQPTPQALALDNGGDEIPALDNDRVFFWNPATQGFSDPATFFVGAGWLDTAFQPANVTPAVGEGFFYNRDSANGATTWDRSFSVN